MSKAVLISIQPKWCELIASGKKTVEKTVEVRKTRPKIDTPFKCYIYCTKPRHYYKISKHLLISDENLFLVNGAARMCDGFGVEYEDAEYKHLNCKVIGEFVCDEIHEFTKAFFDEQEPQDTEEISFWLDQFCLSYNELRSYVGLKDFYGWHITEIVIYDKPKELSAFRRACPDNVYSCAMCRHGDFTGMKCTPIKRPPQSWCYVEEGEDNE